MKQAIFTFLIALMIMPSLACAMPVCADDTPAEVSSAQPCAGHHSENNQTDSSSDRQVNLLLDCMGVDLQTADAVSFNTPDLKTSYIAFPFINETLNVQFLNAKTQSIRGPPYRTSFLEPQRPIFLTTQRFRI
jgi:hypothetical protein